MRFLALGMLVLSAACAPAMQYDARHLKPEEVRPPPYPTIVVDNRGLDRVIVRTANGTSLGRVMAGHARCLNLNGAGELRTYLTFTIEGKTYRSPEFNPLDYEGGWVIVIGTLPHFDMLSLEPLGRCIQRR